jgi:hypothetical protein
MINLINAIILRIQAFIKLQRMNYEMKRSMRCITLISEAIISGSTYSYEDDIVYELSLLEATGVSLASDLTLMLNCLLCLEELEAVTLDDSIDWTQMMKSVSYVKKGVEALSDAVAMCSTAKKIGNLSPNQIRYINKYGDIAQYLLAKSKGNPTLMNQI